MNVLLCITNINGFHEVPYSFGLGTIASYVRENGHNTEIFSVQSENEYSKFEEKISTYKPAVLGFTAVSSQFASVKQLSGLAKNINKDIIVVCGGIHPTLCPHDLLESESIDVFFRGESEIPFGEFLDKVKEEKQYKDINNLVYKENGEIVKNQLLPLIENLEILPFAEKNYLFEDFIRMNGCAPFFFSRGCPHKCSYCSNHAIAEVYGNSRNRPRFRNVNNCIEEIKDTLKKFEFKRLFIMDDILGLDKKWLREFCELYKKEINLDFNCVLRVNYVTEELVKLLKSSGCYRIQFGVESGNEYISKSVMNRNISNEQICFAFDICRKYKIETCALNIIGVPGETEDMIWDTIELNKRIKPTDSGCNIFYPYKGTVLGDYCFSEGLVDEKLYNDFSNERRESVLHFSSEHKKRLQYFHSNWERLIFPFGFRYIKKGLVNYLRKYNILYQALRKVKRAFSMILASQWL